VLGSIYYYFID